MNLFFFILPRFCVPSAHASTVVLNLRVTVSQWHIKLKKFRFCTWKLPFRFHSHPRQSWAQLQWHSILPNCYLQAIQIDINARYIWTMKQFFRNWFVCRGNGEPINRKLCETKHGWFKLITWCWCSAHKKLIALAESWRRKGFHFPSLDMRLLKCVAGGRECWDMRCVKDQQAAVVTTRISLPWNQPPRPSSL